MLCLQKSRAHVKKAVFNEQSTEKVGQQQLPQLVQYLFYYFLTKQQSIIDLQQIHNFSSHLKAI